MLANKARKQIERKQLATKPKVFPVSKVELFINNAQIVKNHNRVINRAWTTGALRQYMQNKYNWKYQVSDNIDWFTLNRCILSQPTHIQLWITRYQHEWLPLHAQHFMNTPSNVCPICNDGPETSAHFQKCEHNEEKYASSFQKFSKIWK